MIVLLIASIIVAVIVRFALVVVAALVTLCQMLLLSAQHAISNLLVVDGLEVCREHLQGLNFEDLAALNVFGPVEAVVAHVEPLHLECWCRVGDVALRQKLQDANYLVEASEMVRWRGHDVPEE